MTDSSPIPPTTEEEGHPPRINDIAKKFITDCIAEKDRLAEDFPAAAMLIDEAIDRVYSTGRIPGREMHADVFKQKLIKVTQKVFVPTKQFPNFNFQGKILGPRGNSLRNLQKDTLCRIQIKGRNSTRGAEKEEEMRQSGDPRHAHLNKNLYVEISTVAAPAEAHARVAYALAEIRKYLIPDNNDEVSQSQRREILADPELAKRARKSYTVEGDDQAAMSILKKINFGAKDTGMEYDEARNIAPRPPMKRSLQEPPPFQQRNEDFEGNARQPYRGQGNTKPGGSILKKITGFTRQLYVGKEEIEDDDEPTFEEEESNYNRGPIRNVTQTPAPKRFFHEPQSYINRRYESPQKRTREAPMAHPSSSRFGNSTRS